MKSRLFLLALIQGAVLFAAPLPGHAAGHLSHERLDLFDRRGYFTPEFKVAVREMIDTQEAVVQAKDEEKKAKADLPNAQQKATDAEAKVAALRQELTQYDHPDEKDFVTLQARMRDTTAKPTELIVLAQAYAWAYPTSPHQAEAQQVLQQMQKKIADQQQADKDAEAARQAARAKLVQRAAAKDLSLEEWKDFLRDMSEEEVLKYLGRPQSSAIGYWVYTGSWTTNPITNQKIGLRVNFNGTRVLNVVEGPKAQ